MCLYGRVVTLLQFSNAAMLKHAEHILQHVMFSSTLNPRSKHVQFVTHTLCVAQALAAKALKCCLYGWVVALLQFSITAMLKHAEYMLKNVWFSSTLNPHSKHVQFVAHTLGLLRCSSTRSKCVNCFAYMVGSLRRFNSVSLRYNGR